MNFLSRYHFPPVLRVVGLSLLLSAIAAPPAHATCLFGPPLDLHPGIALYDPASHRLLGRVLRYETNRRMDDGSFHNAALIEAAPPDSHHAAIWLTREFVLARYAAKTCRP